MSVPPRECLDAPVLALRHLAEYRFDKSHRVRAVRVEVTEQSARAERDISKGDGEIGFGGARHGFDFRLFDASGTLVGSGSSQACFDHHARLPGDPGVYCLALKPLDAQENPTLYVDYAARMHGLGLVQMPEEDVRANIEGVCGR